MLKITTFFKKATPEEAAELAAQGAESIRQHRAWKNAQAISEDDTRATREQKFRQKNKEVEVELGLRDPVTLKKLKPMKLQAPAASKQTCDEADMIDLTDSTLEPISKKPWATRMPWAEPVFWDILTTTGKRVGFRSPQAIVKEVKLGQSGHLFKTLDQGTVAAWINKERTGWSQVAIDRANRAKAVITRREAPRVARDGVKLGRPHTLDPFPSLLDNIVEHLTIIRRSGQVITRVLARGIILAHIETSAPKLLDSPKFKCSDGFIRNILKDKLCWSYRTATQSAHKLPKDYHQQCVHTAMRLAWNIGFYNIPDELVINADQTGVSYLGAGNQTWELKGSKQVPIVGKDEKRQFTLMVAVAASGTMLPWQAIFKGKTKASLPSEAARHPCEVDGFDFVPGGENSWSDLTCLQKWVDRILGVHIDTFCCIKGLPKSQKAILLIDCWAVHRGEEFLSWMKANYPNILILFVPGGCTGVAQPCNLNVNRLLKHLIKSKCVAYLTTEVTKQLNWGIKPAEVIVDTQVATLWNAIADWIQYAWQWFTKHPESVRKAWALAKFGEWDFSYECIGSEKAYLIAREEFTDNQEFAISVARNAPITNDSTAEDDPNNIDHDDDTSLDVATIQDVVYESELPDSIMHLDGSYVSIIDDL